MARSAAALRGSRRGTFDEDGADPDDLEDDDDGEDDDSLDDLDDRDDGVWS